MMQNSCLKECVQFCRSLQEEERVHDRAQQSDQVRRAVDNRDEVEVRWRHRSNPQGDEAWSLQYNQGGRCLRAVGRKSSTMDELDIPQPRRKISLTSRDTSGHL